MKPLLTTTADNSHISMGTAIIRKGNTYLIEQGSGLAQNLATATIFLEAKNHLYKIAYKEYKKRNWLYDTPCGHTLLFLKTLHEYERRYGVNDDFIPDFKMVPLDLKTLSYIHIHSADKKFMEHIVETLYDFNKCCLDDMGCLGYSKEWLMEHIVAPNYIRWVIIPNKLKSLFVGGMPTKIKARLYANLSSNFWARTATQVIEVVARELQTKGYTDIPSRLQEYATWLAKHEQENLSKQISNILPNENK